MVVPIPDSTSDVSGVSIVEAGEEALSVLKIVSLEASKAKSSGVGSLALITDGDANLIGVENPVL